MAGKSSDEMILQQIRFVNQRLQMLEARLDAISKRVYAHEQPAQSARSSPLPPLARPYIEPPPAAVAPVSVEIDPVNPSLAQVMGIDQAVLDEQKKQTEEEREEHREPVAEAVVPPKPVVPIEPLAIADKKDRVRQIGEHLREPVYAPRPTDHPLKSLTQGVSLESKIGLNWTSWVGGIVLVLGMAFFLKYAWDQGWINPSPATRVVLCSALGALMVGAGDWLIRKPMRALGASVGGAGIAIMMASFFGANLIFDPPVLSKGAALTGVAIVAGIGIVQALRLNVMTLAVIALLGAYLGPLALNTGEDRSFELFVYLAVVGMVGWVICVFRPAWRPLRAICFVLAALWTTGWLINVGLRVPHTALAVLWIAYFYAGTVAELVVSMHRLLNSDDEQKLAQLNRTTEMLQSSMCVILTLATVLGAVAMWIILPPATTGLLHPSPLTAILLGIAGVSGVLVFLTPSRMFSITSTMLACLVATAAVPTVFGEHAMTIAWLMMAVGIAAGAVITKSAPMRIWSMVLLFLGIVKLISFDRVLPGLQSTAFEWHGYVFTKWAMLALATGGLCNLFGWMQTKFDANEIVESVVGMLAVTGTALAMWAVGSASTGLLLTGFTFAWALAILYTMGWFKIPAYHVVSLFVLMFAMGKLIFVDGNIDPLDSHMHSLLLLCSAFVLQGVVLLEKFHPVRFGPTLSIAILSVSSIVAIGQGAYFYFNSGTATTTALILWAALILIPLARVFKLPTYLEQTSVLALILLFKWIFVDNMAPLVNAWSRSPNAPIVPVMNHDALNGVLLAALVIVHRILPRASIHPDWEFNTLQFRAIIYGILLFCFVSFELCRLGDWLHVNHPETFDRPDVFKHGALSVSWAAMALAGVVTGMIRKMPPLRYASLGLLGITILKILFIDMAEVQRVYRILSFMAVGILLLVVSYVYHAYEKRKAASVV